MLKRKNKKRWTKSLISSKTIFQKWRKNNITFLDEQNIRKSMASRNILQELLKFFRLKASNPNSDLNPYAQRKQRPIHPCRIQFIRQQKKGAQLFSTLSLNIFSYWWPHSHWPCFCCMTLFSLEGERAARLHTAGPWVPPTSTLTWKNLEQPAVDLAAACSQLELCLVARGKRSWLTPELAELMLHGWLFTLRLGGRSEQEVGQVILALVSNVPSRGNGEWGRELIPDRHMSHTSSGDAWA